MFMEELESGSGRDTKHATDKSFGKLMSYILERKYQMYAPTSFGSIRLNKFLYGFIS